MSLDPAAVRYGLDGLVPGVVQDRADGRVLMVGYLDAEALAATLATGEVHFHSRSRERLWRKGETSGHVLRLRDVALDCDGDALLLAVDPAGPTCHLGTRSCFDTSAAGRDGDAEEAAPRPAEGASRHAGPAASLPTPAAAGQGFVWLEGLWATIAMRTSARPEGSYTARLLGGGVDAVARKVGEEATEVVLAAKDDAAAEVAGKGREDTRRALGGEVADLLYHALVLLAERGMTPADVLAVLRERSRP